jgi:hypothetical protein
MDYTCFYKGKARGSKSEREDEMMGAQVEVKPFLEGTMSQGMQFPDSAKGKKLIFP